MNGGGPPTETEAALVARLRAGELPAFDEAWRLHHARVHSFLWRLIGRRDLADDLLQETFCRLASRAQRLSPETRLRPWLLTVARNLAVSFFRWRLLDEHRLAALVLAAPDAGHSPSPFDESAASQAERRLEAALASLPPKYREVLLLVGVESLPGEEAAAVLGLRPEALRQRLRRARVMLEERLSEGGKGSS